MEKGGGRTWIAIRALLKKFAPQIIVGLLVIACTTLVYYEGGRRPRAELASLQAQYKLAQDHFKSEDTRKERVSKTLTATLEKDHAKKINDIDRNWDSWRADHELRDRVEGATRAIPEPIPIVTNICGDPARDRRLSDAIQRYVSGVADADRQFAGGVAALLGPAERQTAALVFMQRWARGEQELNR